MKNSHGKRRVLWFVNASFSDKDVESLKDGAGKGWLVTLGRELSEELELHVVSVDPYGKDGGIRIRNHYLRPSNWKWKMILNTIWPQKNIEGDLLSQMTHIIDKVNPELIHIHGTEKQYIRLVDEAKQRGIPVLLSLQGLVQPIVHQYFTGYDKQFIKRFILEFGFSKKSLFPRSGYSRFKPLASQALVERDFIGKVEFFGGRTEWDKRISRLWNAESTYYHVDRILKTAYYNKEWKQPNPGSKRIVHTTTGESFYKGLETIAEACFLIQNAGVDIEWRIAGVSKNSWIVRAAKKKLGSTFPTSGLRFMGRMNADEIVDSMMSSEVYVMGSHIENSPNNLAEAMTIGMPCIATNAGGTSTYLKDGESGILLPTADPYGMAGAVMELLSDRPKAAELGAKAFEVARKRHDPKHVLNQIKYAYSDILDNQGSNTPS